MTNRLTPHDTIDDEDDEDDEDLDGDARGPLRIPLLVSEPDPRPAVRRKAIVRIAVLIVVINQLLTTAFAFVVHRNHPDVALGLTTLFSFGLCVVLSVWIRSDAKHAYRNACELGYVSPVAGPARRVRIAPECPRRWLAVLHVELQGTAVLG
ncbi:MAG TPA: hypothetical protein VL689_21315 [Paraburkholderia sp.]|jgi:hypothetical protein|nr:hypothetical protein [Paraburkholderia sp.]